MKALVSVLFFVLASSSAAPGTSELITKEKVSEVMDILTNVAFPARQPHEKVLEALLKSTDRQCIANKFNEHGLQDLILNLDLGRVDTGLAFISSVVLCHPKTDVVLHFLFENLMTNSILYKAFIDDPAVQDYTSYIWCANKYAISKSYLENSVYGSNVKVSADNDEMCGETIMMSELAINSVKSEIQRKLNKLCVNESFKGVQKLLIRAILMIQFDLSAEQKQQEREKFVKGFRAVLEDIFKCSGSQN